MSMDDDDIKAMENRLRTSGWANKPEPYFQASRVRPAAKSLMPPDERVKQAGKWLAHTYGKGTMPTYREIGEDFGLSYDDAVRAVGEAKRIVGGGNG